MRTYTSILSLSLLSISLLVDFQGVASQSTSQLSYTHSDQPVSATPQKAPKKPTQRGTGRREFFQLHKEVTPLA